MSDLKKIRESIDIIDSQMAELYNKRLKLVEEVIEYKIENDLPIYDRQREKDVIKKNSEKVDPESIEYYEEFIKFIIDQSKKIQEKHLKE